MKRLLNFFSVRKSFAREIFVGLLFVSAIPAIVAGSSLVNLVKSQLEIRYEKDALEKATTVSDGMSSYIDEIDNIINRIISENNIIANIDNTDSWEKNKAYTALYQITEGFRNYAGFNVYNRDGQCIFTTESGGGIESLPTYWGILKTSYAHPEKMVIKRAVLPHNKDVLLQTTRSVFIEEDCVGFIVVNIRRADFERILDKVLDIPNGLSIIDSFYEEIYGTGYGAQRSLASIVREKMMNDENLYQNDDDREYIIQSIGDTGLTLILGKEPALTEGITNTMWSVIAAILVASMVLCLTVALFFSKHMSKPIKEMTEAMEKVRRGNLDTAINSRRQDELGELSKQFDSMTEELKNYMAMQVKQQQELNDSNIAMMQAQLNPHFLYNTLDTMKWVAKANQVPEIAKMSADLAQILRTSISENKFVTLKDEIELVGKYAEIQQIRFGGNFTFDVELPIELEDCIVPKLIVQPIVENAVIHGLKEQDKGHIFVNVYEESGTLCIDVSDNGCGISDEIIERINTRNRDNFKGHLGFYNVDTIIKLYYGEAYGLSAGRIAEGGTQIGITLPINKQEE